MSEKLKILMEDLITDAPVTVTYSSELAALPAYNLRDPDPAVPMQTSGTTLTIEADVSALPQPWGEMGLFIGNHNLTTGVSIHFQADDTFAGAPAVDVTLDTSDYIDDTDYRDVPGLFNKLFFRLIDGATTTFSYNKIRITLSDAGNADGYLRIGVLSIGPVGGEENFIYGFSHNATTDDGYYESSTGESYGRPGKAYPQVKFGFQNVGMDMLARLRRWIENGGYQKERWIALSPNGSEGATFTYYGRITELSAIAENLKDPTRGLYTVEMTMDDMIPSPKLFAQSNGVTYADIIKEPNKTHVFLALPMPGEIVTDTWTLDTDATYYIAYPATTETFQVVQVWVDGVKVTRAASLAAAKATPARWFFDIESEKRVYLHTTDEDDPTDHIVELRVLITPAPCTAIPAEDKWLILDVVVDGTTIPNVCFRPNLTDSGLQAISSQLESPYFGVSVPSATGIQVVNGKKRYSDVHGRYDTFPDRFIWKQRYTEIYHGGYPLVFTDYLFLDRYSMLSVECADNIFGTEFDSAAILQKKIPQEIFANDADIRLDYKPWFRGFIEKMPTFQQTANNFAYCGHDIDTLYSVWKGDDPIPSGYTSVHDADESSVDLADAPSKDDASTITVNAQFMRDVDLVAGQSAQYAGAFIRDGQASLIGIPTDELPTTSYQTLDTDYAIQARGYVDGGDNGQTTARAFLDKCARGFFVVIRRLLGYWETFRFDLNNLPASVATIYSDEWITCSREVESEAIIRRARIGYFTDLALGKSKFVTGNHPTAATIYPSTEILEVQETFVKEESDASAVRDLYLAVKGTEQMVIKGQATGEIFKAWPGDVVTIYRAKGFSETGAWNPQTCIVREITKHCAARPGFCDVVLVVPATALSTNSEAGGDVVYLSHNSGQAASPGTVGEVTSITVTYNCPSNATAVVISVSYNMGVGADDPDVVQWNSVDCTLIGTTSTSTNIRAAMYVLFATDVGFTTGSHDAYVHFPSDTDGVALNVSGLANATAVRDFADVYQATGQSISGSVTSAAGDMVMDVYCVQAAPPLNQHSYGSGQIAHMAQRVPFNGSFAGSDAMDGYASHKDGAASSITMSHTEEINNSRKALFIASFQA